MARPKKIKSPNQVAVTAWNDANKRWEAIEIGPNGGLTLDRSLYAKRYDESSSTIAYLGVAAIGTASGAATWRICRITTSSGDITIEWADGNANFDNIWDNRASLTYT